MTIMTAHLPLILYSIAGLINISTLVLIKYASNSQTLGMTLSQIIFYKSLFALIMLSLSKPIYFKILVSSRKHIIALSIIAILGILDVYLWNYGFKMVPINNGMILLFLSPIITSIFSILILKESPTKDLKWSLMVNTVAVLITYHFISDKFNIGYLMILLCLFVYATMVMLFKKLPQYSSGFFVFIRLLLLTPVSFMLMEKQPEWTLKSIICIILISIGFMIERILTTYVYEISTVSNVQPMRYLNLVYSMILSYFILGEKLTIYQLVGGSIVILSTLYRVYYVQNRDTHNAS